MKEIKKHLYSKVEIIALIVFIIICAGLLFAANHFNKSNPKSGYNLSKVSLGYLPTGDQNLMIDISLTKKEKKELIDLVNKLEYSEDVTDCIFTPEYYIKSAEYELYLDKECGMALHKETNKTDAVKSGGKEIREYLEKKISKNQNISLFSLNENDQTYNKIDISKKDQEELRKLWKKQNKEPQKMNLIILAKYALYIDGDIIGIESLNSYVSYNNPYYAGEFIELDEEVKNVLSGYIKDSEGDCCTCCPDLQPGESCIDMCCPCN